MRYPLSKRTPLRFTGLGVGWTLCPPTVELSAMETTLAMRNEDEHDGCERSQVVGYEASGLLHKNNFDRVSNPSSRRARRVAAAT